MSRFLYYVPGHRNVILRADKWEELAREKGFWEAVRGTMPECRGVEANGPDAKSGGPGIGMCFRAGEGVDVDGEAALGVYLNQQRWVKGPDGKYWVGMFKESPPSPTELMRADALGGNPMVLKDGQEWVVPVALYAIDRMYGVPRILGITEEGEEVMEVEGRYRPFFEMATQFLEDVMKKESDGSLESTVDMKELSTLALTTNYHVGAIEVAMLGVLSDDVFFRVCTGTLNEPEVTSARAAYLESIKKKSDAGILSTSDGGSGVRDDCRDTERPVGTSASAGS